MFCSSLTNTRAICVVNIQKYMIVCFSWHGVSDNYLICYAPMYISNKTSSFYSSAIVFINKLLYMVAINRCTNLFMIQQWPTIMYIGVDFLKLKITKIYILAVHNYKHKEQIIRCNKTYTNCRQVPSFSNPVSEYWLFETSKLCWAWLSDWWSCNMLFLEKWLFHLLAFCLSYWLFWI